jgi:hypothetical protein
MYRLDVPAGGGEGGCLVWCRGGFGTSNVAEFVVSTRSSSTSDADHAPHDQRLGLVLDQGRIAGINEAGRRAARKPNYLVGRARQRPRPT